MAWLLLMLFTLEEPRWEMYPAIRQVNDARLGRVLSDISSRLEAGNQYEDSDKITSGHEQVHGINSYARMKFRDKYPGKRINCFYCMNGRVCVIEEPRLTITQVANSIPRSFRGEVYQTYLVNQRKDWDQDVLYLLDEFSAYNAGTEIYRELGIVDRESTIWQSFEFINYSLFLLKLVKENRPDYEDTQLRLFIKWNVERCMRLYRGEAGAEKYLNLLRNHPEGKELRDFVKKYYGEPWYEKVIVKELFWE